MNAPIEEARHGTKRVSISAALLKRAHRLDVDALDRVGRDSEFVDGAAEIIRLFVSPSRGDEPAASPLSHRQASKVTLDRALHSGRARARGFVNRGLTRESGVASGADSVLESIGFGARLYRRKRRGRAECDRFGVGASAGLRIDATRLVGIGPRLRRCVRDECESRTFAVGDGRDASPWPACARRLECSWLRS
jgi:hypothetical protein